MTVQQLVDRVWVRGLRWMFYRWRNVYRHRMPWKGIALGLAVLLVVSWCLLLELLRYIAVSA